MSAREPGAPFRPDDDWAEDQRSYRQFPNDAPEGTMTTATIETGADEDDINDLTPRRVVLITIGILLPEDLNEYDIADIIPTSLTVTGAYDTDLTDFIQVRVQEAHLVMT